MTSFQTVRRICAPRQYYGPLVMAWQGTARECMSWNISSELTSDSVWPHDLYTFSSTLATVHMHVMTE